MQREGFCILKPIIGFPISQVDFYLSAIPLNQEPTCISV